MSYKTKRVERTEEVTRYSDVRCDGCNKELEPVFPDCLDDGLWDNLQADGALGLYFSGGYGMYIDPMGSVGNHTALLCSGCAGSLLALFPSLRRVVGA